MHRGKSLRGCRTVCTYMIIKNGLHC